MEWELGNVYKGTNMRSIMRMVNPSQSLEDSLCLTQHLVRLPEAERGAGVDGHVALVEFGSFDAHDW